MTDPSTPESDTAAIVPDLLEILVCPLTRAKLRQEGLELIAEVGGLRYPIRDGIPIMLIDEATMPPGIANLEEFKEKYKDQIPQ
jgi:hypothetical protein